jgi:hypothetical protein
VLGVVLAAAAPGGSYLTAVPALVAALAGTVGLLAGSAWARLLAGLVAGAVAVLVLAPTIALFFPALGLATGAAPALFVVLLGLVLLPVLEPLFGSAGAGRASRALVPGVAVLLTVALFGTGLVVDRFDAAHPVPTQLMYALDADTGEAWWISTEDDPGAWTAAYLDGHQDLSGTFPLLAGDLATGAAEPADLPAPTLTTSATDLGNGRRAVTVQVRSQRAARLLVLDVAGARVTGATVAGRDVPAEVLGEDRLTVTFHAPPDGGVDATVVVEGDGPVTVRALDGSDGLADLPGFTPRPEGVGVAGTHTSDLLLVATSRTV